MKRSAAALIAKKQGCQISVESDQIADPRISEEIRNYRQREEELKRSRDEMMQLEKRET